MGRGLCEPVKARNCLGVGEKLCDGRMSCLKGEEDGQWNIRGQQGSRAYGEKKKKNRNGGDPKSLTVTDEKETFHMWSAGTQQGTNKPIKKFVKS